MSSSEKFLQLLIADGVVQNEDAVLTPLGGGISSDIYRVDDGDEVFVIKRALPKLRVRDDWFVDVSRNHYEHEYLRYVGRLLPGAVPAIRCVHDEHGYFAMEYLDDFDNWRQLLLAGICSPAHASCAGQLLGTIHRGSADDRESARRFDSTSNFHQLRTDPYLVTTGRRHPELQNLFQAEAGRLDSTHECLVHGDYSPKNILCKANRMVILDCEVAWYGDPTFDVAFLLNHLFLKSLHLAPGGDSLADMIHAAWRSYGQARGDVGATAAVADRLGRLLLMLMLSRIDGKSPADYLTDDMKKQFVRDFVYEHLPCRKLALEEVVDRWFQNLQQRFEI